MASKQQHQPSATSILESLFRSSAPGMSTFRVLYNLEVEPVTLLTHHLRFINNYLVIRFDKSVINNVCVCVLGVEFKANAHIR